MTTNRYRYDSIWRSPGGADLANLHRRSRRPERVLQLEPNAVTGTPDLVSGTSKPPSRGGPDWNGAVERPTGRRGLCRLDAAPSGPARAAPRFGFTGRTPPVFLCEFPIEIRSRGADKRVFWWLLGSEALQLRPNAVWEAFQRPRRRSTGKPLSELTATPERLRTGESM